jgi:uncharacterized membrane protein YeaQ/YmgE (transglycosylase-associated protein family)
MSIIVFILIGVAACAFTYRFCNSSGAGIAVDLFLCITGAVIAGMFFSRSGTIDAAGGIICGIAGATAPLAAYHAVLRDR